MGAAIYTDRPCASVATKVLTMRSWLLLVTLAASLSGCDCCWQHQYCDGDQVMTCENICPHGSGKGDLSFDCHKSITAMDCPSGQTCTPLTDHGQSLFECVDKPLTACGAPDGGPLGDRSSATLGCTPSGQTVTCYGVGHDAGLQRTTDFCGATHTCHPTPLATACVDSPKVSCVPADHPRCRDAMTLVKCVGTDADGWAAVTFQCGAAGACGQPDGGGPPRCYNVVVPDGG